MGRITIKNVLSAMGAVIIGIGSLQSSNSLIFIGTIILVVTSIMMAGLMEV